MFGLSERSLNYIKQELKKHPEINKALIFGSRSKNNFKKGSDVDIALVGKDVTIELAWNISGKLNEELPLPYFFDVLSYGNINNLQLKDHVDRVGIIFYSCTNQKE